MSKMAYTRSVIVTGGTMNMGFFAARELARQHPDYLIVISSRSDHDQSAAAINKTLGQNNVIFLPLDLTDLDGVRTYAKDWASKGYPPIQALVLNAALQFPGPLKKTAAGVEMTFAISHVGHALLFHLLVPYLAQNARVVVVSSGTHDPAQKSGLPDAKYTSAEDLAHPPADMVDIPGRQRYASTKLANVLWAYSLRRHLAQRAPERGISVVAIDPGLMPGSGLAREAGGFLQFLWMHILPRIIPLVRILLGTGNIFLPEQSGKALARIALGDEFKDADGKYLSESKAIKSSKDSYDESKQEDLWSWTIKFVSNGDETEMKRFEEFK